MSCYPFNICIKQMNEGKWINRTALWQYWTDRTAASLSYFIVNTLICQEFKSLNWPYTDFPFHSFLFFLILPIPNCTLFTCMLSSTLLSALRRVPPVTPLKLSSVHGGRKVKIATARIPKNESCLHTESLFILEIQLYNMQSRLCEVKNTVGIYQIPIKWR